MAYPQLKPDAGQPLDSSLALERISKDFSADTISYLRLADEQYPYVQLITKRDHRYYFNINAELVVIMSDSSPWVWLSHLHGNWLAGKNGKAINGFLALTVLFITIIGVLLIAKEFEWRKVFRGFKGEQQPLKRSFFRHYGLGVLSLPALLLFTVTAVMFIYRSEILKLTDSHKTELARTVISTEQVHSSSAMALSQLRFAEVLTALSIYQPRLQFTFISFSHWNEGKLVVTAKQRTGLHPNGRYRLLVSLTNDGAVATIEGSKPSNLEQLLSSAFAIHAGYYWLEVTPLLYFINGLVIIALCAVGIQLAIRRRQAKWP
ncbi:hypothetical protein GCM10007894_27630 [Paraferrimonas haliotis]|uniref:PepSY-associated TM region n=2 Tax=Paraferrimonas haliotis TaxID=2013866 RepID=A0AA37X0K2_9GAMM|nr:hypothetical protein GCM10007894_27630 [Paraferrimonas haliotis]